MLLTYVELGKERSIFDLLIIVIEQVQLVVYCSIEIRQKSFQGIC